MLQGGTEQRESVTGVVENADRRPLRRLTLSENIVVEADAAYGLTQRRDQLANACKIQYGRRVSEAVSKSLRRAAIAWPLILVDHCGVAKGYVPLRRDELMLLPPDVRDWLPADHVVWFLIDAVAAMDTSPLHRRAKLGGAGRAPYDPDMLLVVLIYAYAGGLRSSRRIEKRCREDVAFMVASGLCYPDHVTIANFRKDNDEAIAHLFTQVLQLCGPGRDGPVGARRD